MATVHQGASWEENGVHTRRVPGERGTDPEMAGALIVSGAGGEGGVTQWLRTHVVELGTGRTPGL